MLAQAIVDQSTSQAAVARSAGMSESQLSRALRGMKSMSLDEFEAACIALGLEAAVVLAEADGLIRRNRGPATVTKLPTRRPAPKAPLTRVARPRSSDRGGDDGQG